MSRSRRTGSGPSRPSGRGLTTRVKTARRRRPGSTRWLARQLNDPYVEEARRQGFRSRAAFKLLQLDDRFALMRPGMRLVDLGAAPGGWTQVAINRIRPDATGGRIVAVDLTPIELLAGARFLNLDVLAEDAPQQIAEAAGGPVDLVLSDMAAPTTGHAGTDHLRTIALAEAALDIAEAILAPGGGFVCKVFQGGSEKPLLDRLRRFFAKVRHAKPEASRRESSELYVIATGFRDDRDGG